MKRAMVLVFLLIAACGGKVVCNAPYIGFGDGCCLDANGNSICDSDETVKPAATTPSTAPPATTTTPSATTTKPTTTTVKPKTIEGLRSELGSVLNTYDSFTQGKVIALHGELTGYDAFTFFGSPSVDVLEIRDADKHMAGFDDALALIEDYAVARKAAAQTKLAATYDPQNKSFTLYSDVTPVTLRTGHKAIEYRDYASVRISGVNYKGVAYDDWVDPYGALTIYLPCGPNFILAFPGSNTNVAPFAANYEGDEYLKELQTSMNEMSQKAQYKAEKIAGWCGR